MERAAAWRRVRATIASLFESENNVSERCAAGGLCGSDHWWRAIARLCPGGRKTNAPSMRPLCHPLIALAAGA